MLPSENAASDLERILGICLAKEGNWEEAETHLKKVAKDDQDLPFVDAAVETYLYRGDLTKALELGERFKEMDKTAPFDLTTIRDRMKALAQTENLKNEVKAIELLLCAEILQEKGRPGDEILELLDQIAPGLKMGQSTPSARWWPSRMANFAALCRKRKKQLSSAPRIRPAITLGPNTLRGIPKDATEDLQKAVELSQSKNGLMLHWLATSLLADGKREEAKKIEKEAASLLPDNSEIAEQLKELEEEKTAP